jgi:hypothetical protein
MRVGGSLAGQKLRLESGGRAAILKRLSFPKQLGSINYPGAATGQGREIGSAAESDRAAL